MKVLKRCGGCGFALPDDRVCNVLKCNNDYTQEPEAFAALENFEFDLASDKKCPFCGEDAFDLVGLKSHLLNFDCVEFGAVDSISRIT